MELINIPKTYIICVMVKIKVSGWRAIIGEDFIRTNIAKIALALVDIIERKREPKKFIIGYDRRFLSREAAIWFSEELVKHKIDVYFIDGRVPTPMVMFSMRQNGFPFGAEITASHNPALYNGIKLFAKEGRYADEELIESINDRVARMNEPVIVSGSERNIEANTCFHFHNPKNEYFQSLLSFIDVKRIEEKNIKVVADFMYGAATYPLSRLLLSSGCELKTIHESHDTLFGKRHPAPSADALFELCHLVPKSSFDIGIATDGDGDRIGIVDEAGNYVSPNEILLMLYHYFLKYKGVRKPIVRNLSTTHALDALAAEYGVECYETPVGFRYVSDKMEETGAIIGGESSGGFAIEGHIHGKDGIFAAAIFLDMLSCIDVPLSVHRNVLVRKYGGYFFFEKNYHVTAETKENFHRELFLEKKLPEMNLEIERIDELDGLKIYLSGGAWFLIRFSQTEPLFRIQGEVKRRKTKREILNAFDMYISPDIFEKRD